MTNRIRILHHDRPACAWVANATRHLYDEPAAVFSNPLFPSTEPPLSKPRLIICERTGCWATAFARQLPDAVRLVQTRGLAECAAELAAAPASLLALEVTTGNLASVVELLVELAARFPAARAVVLADTETRLCEDLLREAGAIHVFDSPRKLEGMRATIRNHLAHAGTADVGFAESVWDALPWREAAST